MKYVSKITVVAIIYLMLVASPAEAVTINFDDANLSPPPINSYNYSGVVLPTGAWVYALPSAGNPNVHARSGSNVLVSRDPGGEYDPNPLVIIFTAKQDSVTLYTGIPWNTYGNSLRMTLSAYDDSNSLVNQSVKYLVGPSNITEEMRVTSPAGQSPAIKRIELEMAAAGFEFIDDLTFETSAPPPPPVTKSPTVLINEPTPGTVISVGGDVTLTGTIHGEGLYPDVNRPIMEHTYARNPALFQPPYYTWRQTLMLGTDLQWVNATPPYLVFSLKIPIYELGGHTIKVTASNAAGAGSALTDIMLLPDSIANLYKQAGGFATFGSFVWGDASGSCQFAIYEEGAIFSSSAGTFSVLGKIFTKWKRLSNIGSSLGRLGCPTGPQKTVNAPDTSGVYQDFAGGRVYSSPVGTYYVIEPFVDAIDKYGSVNPATSSFDKDYPGSSTPPRDFVMDYGFPVTDPVEQNLILRPRLWQKFQTTINNIPLISTMEVTENPLRLWIATPDLHGVRRAGVQDNEVSSRIPTIWREFTCSQLGQPCSNVGLPASVPKTPYSELATACNNSHYGVEDVLFGPDTPEWPPLRKVKKIDSCMGNIMSAGMAGQDAPTTHSCICPYTDIPKWGVDWCIHIKPDPGFEWILGGDLNPGHPLLAQVQPKLEIEYEWCSVQYPHHKGYNLNYPNKKQEDYLKKGDKLFVAGLWISDCGCHPTVGCTDRYKSEIHP
ncbi:MAG: LGFP repeat-containing protein, partial [Planctomycetota bacterium]